VLLGSDGNARQKQGQDAGERENGFFHRARIINSPGESSGPFMYFWPTLGRKTAYAGE
jgi:hypothetical protein